MDDLGVALSIVAMGQGSASYLERLAERGEGCHIPVGNARDVLQVFVDEEEGDTLSRLRRAKRRARARR